MEKKLRFFIVDDDPDVISFLTTVLESAGHQVSHETSGNVALTSILAARPDCILIDIMIPGMDGLALCNTLRAREEFFRATKIVVISAKPYEYDRRRAMELGADGFINKPIDADTLLPQLERIVEDRIEVTFWGVRGTIPVPGSTALKYGGNTPCVVMQFGRGQLFIFDAGTGIKAFSDHLVKHGLQHLKAKIFISHPHLDHINALPFFAPLYRPGNEFEILGPAHGDISVNQLISAQMDGVYFPIRLKEFGAHVRFRDLSEESLMIDGIDVKTLFLNHPGTCLGYRVEYNGSSVCYVTDNELYPRSSQFFNQRYRDRLTDFVAGSDALITDTTYTDAEYETHMHWGHSRISEVVDLADQARVKTLYLFHHDPAQTDADIDTKLETARALLKRLDSATECIAPAEKQTFKI